MRVKIIGIALLLALTVSTSALASSALPVSETTTAALSLGAEFASGQYGTDSTVRSLYLPLIATWLPTERWDISIEIPLIYQTSSHVTTELYRSSQGTMTATAAAYGGPGGNSGGGSQLEAGSSSSSVSSASDVSGLGDILLRAGFIAHFEGSNTPQLRPSLFVKFPTASTKDGLGTGEFDAGIGVDASQWFGNVNISGEGVYTWQRKAAGFGLKNYASLTTGVGYQLTENVRPILILKGATAPSTYSDSLLEVRARVLWFLSNRTALDLYASRGLTESTPDYGGGMTVSYSF